MESQDSTFIKNLIGRRQKASFINATLKEHPGSTENIITYQILKKKTTPHMHELSMDALLYEMFFTF